jgi:ATP-dependent DNA helicase RecG
MDNIDLATLSVRESDQVEWKENVADVDDVVATLAAFANDWANLGGGYVVCGAKEDKDAYGFPRVEMKGLSAARLKEIEGRVLDACRVRVSPPIIPLVQELPGSDANSRVLVFVMPATRDPHLFRRGEQTGKYYVRISRQTREARNGVLRELLIRKGAMEEWDRRVCPQATVNDLDLLALRDALQRMRVFLPDRGLDAYLSESQSLSPFVPPLCVREPLTGVLRPRNYAMLLFGRDIQRFIPGAYSLFSVYPGGDRSEPHAERHELAGSLIDQARRLGDLLSAQSYVLFDKTSKDSPNALKYPPQALHEAMINALAHRDYEVADPTRITVFSDRVEVLSPGPLPLGIDLEEFQAGKAPAKWRNQCLAWFLNRLQLAQAEGQGIPTIVRTMREEGCPPAVFQANVARVTCVLPAHPRHKRNAV